MASPYDRGILTGSILPLIYTTPELNNVRLTAHQFLVDYYSEYFKHFGFTRDEMMIVMPDIMRVDVLTGTQTDNYLPAPKNAFKM